VVSFRIGIGGVAVGNVCARYGDLLPGCLEGLREMSIVGNHMLLCPYNKGRATRA
jgi:hypothetical protein